MMTARPLAHGLFLSQNHPDLNVFPWSWGKVIINILSNLSISGPCTKNLAYVFLSDVHSNSAVISPQFTEEVQEG